MIYPGRDGGLEKKPPKRHLVPVSISISKNTSVIINDHDASAFRQCVGSLVI